MLVEPSPRGNRCPGDPERDEDRGPDRLAGTLASPEGLLHREDPGHERDADAQHGGEGKPREGRACRALPRVEEVADEDPVVELGDVSSLCVEGERGGPRDQEPESHERGAPEALPASPGHRDRDPCAEGYGLVLEERGDGDAQATEDVEAKPRFRCRRAAAVAFRADGAEERHGRGQVHEHLGIHRGHFAQAAEERDPRRRPSHIVAARPLPRRLSQDEAGTDEPRDAEQMDWPERHAAEDPSRRVREIGERGLDVDGVHVGQAAVEDAAAHQPEVDLIEVEDVEEERGASQSEGRGEKGEKGARKKPHYPTSSLMSTMAGAGASSTRAGSTFQRRRPRARWMRPGSGSATRPAPAASA